MSNYRRMYRTGATYFFTVTLADRGSHLLIERVAELRRAYAAVTAEYLIKTNAIVVMPDHIHAMWTLPEGDVNYSVRWGAIKARFTMELRRAGFSPPDDLPVVTSGRFAGLKPGLRSGKRERGIWQRRFWEHTIRDEADFTAHMHYCWGNPVKHGFVARAVDWPYSSIHRDIWAGQVDPEWVGDVPEGAFGE